MKTLSIKFMFAGFLTVLINASNAFAEPWCHVPLKATDGTVVQLDYQVRRVGLNHSPDAYVMAYLHAQVKNEAFDGSEDVSIVLMNPASRAVPTASRTLTSIPYDGKKFTGKASDLDEGRYAPYIKYDLPGSYFHLELAVVVDGVWLKEPVTGESNFRFNANKYHEMCANPF